MKPTQPKLGVDIGGVIIDRVHEGSDTSFFGPNFLQTAPVPGVFGSLRALTLQGWEIHLVSKCGPSVQNKSLRWLEHHRFYALTGVAPERVHFCLARADKAPICTRLGLQAFVDDRLDVLDYLEDVALPILFQPNPRDRQQHRQRGQDRIRCLDRWTDVEAYLGETKKGPSPRQAGRAFSRGQDSCKT